MEDGSLNPSDHRDVAIDFTRQHSQNEAMATKTISRKPTDASAALTVVRLSLQGALLGVALVGIFTQAQHYDLVGAVVGGLIVLVAKLKHFF